MAKLTEKQIRFVSEYLVDLNATAAAIRAGYSEKTACEQASRLLANVNVQEEVSRQRKELQDRLHITQDRVLSELAAVAFASAADFLTIQSGCVKIKDTDDVPQAILPALAGAKEGRWGVEIRLHDKVRALEKLGEHLGLFTGKGSGDAVKENNLFEVLKALSREEVSNAIPELQPASDDDGDMVDES